MFILTKVMTEVSIHNILSYFGLCLVIFWTTSWTFSSVSDGSLKIQDYETCVIQVNFTVQVSSTCYLAEVNRLGDIRF